MPFRRYFRKMREGRRTHQIHLVERSNPEVAEEYTRLKYELSSRIPYDREAYTDAKTDFISKVVRRAQENQRS